MTIFTFVPCPDKWNGQIEKIAKQKCDYPADPVWHHVLAEAARAEGGDFVGNFIFSLPYGLDNFFGLVEVHGVNPHFDATESLRVQPIHPDMMLVINICRNLFGFEPAAQDMCF
jgi:hypothetical protein